MDFVFRSMYFRRAMMGLLMLGAAPFGFGCSPAPAPSALTEQKSSTQSQTATPPPAALVALSLQEAGAYCNKDATGSAYQVADFDGDGQGEIVLDWAKTPCALASEVCASSFGCTLTIWRQTAHGPSQALRAQAKAATIAQALDGRATITLEQNGQVCGRPSNEICKSLFAWNEKVGSLQEVAREIIPSSVPSPGTSSLP